MNIPAPLARHIMYESNVFSMSSTLVTPGPTLFLFLSFFKKEIQSSEGTHAVAHADILKRKKMGFK